MKLHEDNAAKGDLFTTGGEEFEQVSEQEVNPNGKTLPTNWARPIASPTPFKVHAKTRIVTAGTISLKPSDRLSIKLLKVMTFRGRYSAIINRIVTTEAKIRLVSASHPANAEITLSAPPRKPV